MAKKTVKAALVVSPQRPQQRRGQENQKKDIKRFIKSNDPKLLLAALSELCVSPDSESRLPMISLIKDWLEVADRSAAREVQIAVKNRLSHDKKSKVVCLSICQAKSGGDPYFYAQWRYNGHRQIVSLGKNPQLDIRTAIEKVRQKLPEGVKMDEDEFKALLNTHLS